MNPNENARLGSVASRRGRCLMAVGSAVVAAVALAIVASGCGSSTAAVAETPAPTPTATAVAASGGAVWALVGADQTPLFGLVVTETQGFSTAERNYLRGGRVAWSEIGSESTEYAGLVTSNADPAAAARLIRRIERQATVAARAPSPSARFTMLRDSMRYLMRRVVRMARTTQEHASATIEAEKTTFANKLARLVLPLSAETLVVADWGVEMRNRYGAVYYAAVSSTLAPAAPVPASTSTPAPQPNPNPNPNPNPTSSPQPAPPLTSAETKQVAAVAELDAWLTGVMTDASASVEAQSLPWSDEQVNSFSLNMSYLIDQCDRWLSTAPAGPSIADGFRQYQRGLSLVRKGASQLETAALYNDTAHQKALNKGNTTLNSAQPDLKSGLSKMQAFR